MNYSCFIGGLYVAIGVAFLVTVSGALQGVSMLTIVIRAALAFATFAFLGWVAEKVLSQVSWEDDGLDGDDELRGAMVDVTLPATDDEPQGQLGAQLGSQPEMRPEEQT